jgi:hypothetical protein
MLKPSFQNKKLLLTAVIQSTVTLGELFALSFSIMGYGLVCRQRLQAQIEWQFFPKTLIFVTELKFVFWIVRDNSNNRCYHSNSSTFQVKYSLLKYAKVDLSF